MRQKIVYLSLAVACLLIVACRISAKDKLVIQIPEGLVTATKQQEQFVEKVKTLKYNMSKEDVKKHLGKPNTEKPDQMNYHLVESKSEGGYYINAKLVFKTTGLSVVTVDHGHETRTPRKE